MRRFTLAGESIDLVTISLTIGAGILGGFAFKLVGAPMPMLLGSVIAVGLLSIFGVRLGGNLPAVPGWLRPVFVPIIGLSIGAAFTPAILMDITRWWPSLIALLVFIPVSHLFGFASYRYIGRLQPSTAFYGSVPGGLVEAIVLGEQVGADVRMLTALQFMRLILTIMLVPLAFTFLTGAAVGTAGGALKEMAAIPLSARETLLQAILAISGFFLGRWMRLPAYMITGPILFSGIGHLSGFLISSPPIWLIEVTQLAIGLGLGTRFAGMQVRAFGKALGLALLNIASTMTLAIIAGVLLHQLVGERIEAVVLAFAPGGLAEMSLVAISLNVSAIYVTAHHVTRIMLSVMFAKMLSGFVLGPPEPDVD